MPSRSNRIAVDYREVGNQPAGRGRYVAALFQALWNIEDSSRYLLMIDGNSAGQLPPAVAYWQSRNNGILWHWDCYRTLEKDASINLFCATRSPIVPAFTSKKCLLFVYDCLVGKAERTMNLRALVTERAFTKAALRRAAAIIAISRSTADDIGRLEPGVSGKIHIVYGAAHQIFRRLPPDRAIIEAYAVPDRYILCVGTLEPRKNHETLFKAYAGLPLRVRENHKLVIAGKRGWHFDRIQSSISDLGIQDSVIFIGYVPDDHLLHLYNAATAFVYPSLYEGFGLPVAEAMQCGVPVITSNISSLPEITGDAAILVPPTSVSSLTQALEKILTDSALREHLSEKSIERMHRFNWSASALKFKDVLDALE